MYLVLSLIVAVTIFVKSNGCTIELFEHCDYSGNVWNFDGPTRRTGAVDFDNGVISSLRAYSEPNEYCAFYLFFAQESTLRPVYYFQLKNGDSGQINLCEFVDTGALIGVFPIDSIIGGIFDLSILNLLNYNDKISSLIVREERPDCLVELYLGELFSESYDTFGLGRYTLGQMQTRDNFLDDDISSMQVTANPGIDCVIELYEYDNYEGAIGTIPIPRDTSKKIHKFSLTDLKQYGFENDALSSMVVKVKETIQSVTWYLDKKEEVKTAPYAMGKVFYDNLHSSSSITWSKTLTNEISSTWDISYTHTVGASVEWSTEFGIPFFGTSTLSVSLSYEFKTSSSNGGETKNSYSETVEKEINPGQQGYCEWTMKKANIDIPFTATINAIDGYGQYITKSVGGIWKGVTYYDSTIKCVDK